MFSKWLRRQARPKSGSNRESDLQKAPRESDQYDEAVDGLLSLDPSEEAQLIAEYRRAGEEKRGRLAPKSFEAAANEAALTAIEAGFGMKLVVAAIQHAQGTYGEALLAAMDRDSAYRLAVTTAAYETAFAHVLTFATGPRSDAAGPSPGAPE